MNARLEKLMNEKHDVQPISQSTHQDISPFIVVFLIFMWTSVISPSCLTTSFVSLWPHHWPDSWVLCTYVYGSTSSFLPRYLQARLCDLAPSLHCPVSCLTSDYSGLMLVSNKFSRKKNLLA